MDRYNFGLRPPVPTTPPDQAEKVFRDVPCDCGDGFELMFYSRPGHEPRIGRRAHECCSGTGRLQLIVDDEDLQAAEDF